MQETNPEKIYQRQVEQLEAEEKKLLKQKNLLYLLRLTLAVLAIAALWKLWALSIIVAFIVFFILTGIFIAIVLRDLKTKETLENIRLLKTICSEEIRILNYDFLHLPGGLELCPAHHAYAQDLDLLEKLHCINISTAPVQNKGISDWRTGC